jgi:hypothetical protein
MLEQEKVVDENVIVIDLDFDLKTEWARILLLWWMVYWISLIDLLNLLMFVMSDVMMQ